MSLQPSDLSKAERQELNEALLGKGDGPCGVCGAEALSLTAALLHQLSRHPAEFVRRRESLERRPTLSADLPSADHALRILREGAETEADEGGAADRDEPLSASVAPDAQEESELNELEEPLAPPYGLSQSTACDIRPSDEEQVHSRDGSPSGSSTTSRSSDQRGGRTDRSRSSSSKRDANSEKRSGSRPLSRMERRVSGSKTSSHRSAESRTRSSSRDTLEEVVKAQGVSAQSRARVVHLGREAVGVRARRCRHNEESCRDFPRCLGRLCPRRHPACPELERPEACLAQNVCPFEHREMEKACGRCEGRQAPPDRARLLLRCPHRKARDCRSLRRLGAVWCPQGAACNFRHFFCPNMSHCHSTTCVFEHPGVPYFCQGCAKISPLKR